RWSTRCWPRLALKLARSMPSQVRRSRRGPLCSRSANPEPTLVPVTASGNNSPMFDLISQRLFATPPRETLYHYTTLSGLLGIVDSAELRCSDILYMTDST